jgi:hypothetical protein
LPEQLSRSHTQVVAAITQHQHALQSAGAGCWYNRSRWPGVAWRCEAGRTMMLPACVLVVVLFVECIACCAASFHRLGRPHMIMVTRIGWLRLTRHGCCSSSSLHETARHLFVACILFCRHVCPSKGQLQVAVTATTCRWPALLSCSQHSACGDVGGHGSATDTGWEPVWVVYSC